MAGPEINTTIQFIDYLKVTLTGPVLFSLIALFFLITFKEDIKAMLLRIAKIKLPGGTELTMPQSTRDDDETTSEIQLNVGEIQDIPTDLNQNQKKEVEELIRSHIATSYLWEYRYLNYFLVRGTQDVLDWLIGLPQPTNYSHYDSIWLPIIPSANERQSIINALQSHHLIYCPDSNGLIKVTPKGLEYQEWRGTLPSLTNTST